MPTQTNNTVREYAESTVQFNKRMNDFGVQMMASSNKFQRDMVAQLNNDTDAPVRKFADQALDAQHHNIERMGKFVDAQIDRGMNMFDTMNNADRDMNGMMDMANKMWSQNVGMWQDAMNVVQESMTCMTDCCKAATTNGKTATKAGK